MAALSSDVSQAPATVDANVPDWLEFDWDTGVPGIEDPTGRFTFGIYGGDKNQVYRRELY